MLVSFKTPAKTRSLGRYGYVRTTGLCLRYHNGDVHLHPVTSRGRPANSVRIVVPRRELWKVARMLGLAVAST